MTLDELKTLLKTTSVKQVVFQHVLSNSPVCLGGDANILFDLNQSIAKHFAIHNKEIEIVGSGKLGFSLNPTAGRYGKPYDKTSDIDIAIVSPKLFDMAWHELSDVSTNAFATLSTKDQERLKNSLKYIGRGIVSPNELPLVMEFSKKWYKIFNEVSALERFEKRKVAGRLFKDWHFAENYYSKQLSTLSQT